MLRYATGDYAGKMLQIGLNIDGHSMKADPFAQADTDGRNFIFCQSAAGVQGLVGSCDPNADPAGANLTCDVELSQGLNDPIFQLLHKVSHI